MAGASDEQAEPPPTATARLLVAARGGDRDAREELHARHQGRLLTLIRARTPPALRHRVAPEDVLQETLLESSRKLDGFEPSGPGAFYRWLAAIARHKLAEAVRAQRADRRAREEPLGHPPAASQSSPSGRAIRDERAERLATALSALPRRRALAVRLRYLEGLSVAETAGRLGCTGPAVKPLVARGLAELYRSLDPGPDGPGPGSAPG